MKSNSIRGIAGNIKLRGKKQQMLDCGCCDVYNFKCKMIDKHAEREIREYNHSQQKEDRDETTET